MSENRWHAEDSWPAAGSESMTLYLSPDASGATGGALVSTPPLVESAVSSMVSDPMNPVTDPYEVFGPHDYRDLAGSEGVLVFDTAPLERDLEVSGPLTAEIYLSCDCADTDLWVRLLDVRPDGSAFNLMSPGLDVVRASYRDLEKGRQLLEPGTVYRLDFENLLTSNVFRKGHRVRIQISTAFSPHFSRNLHTGKLEIDSAEARAAKIDIHHDRQHPSAIVLSVIQH